MTVRYETCDRVAVITLACEDALNAMDRQMYRDVNAAFTRFNEDEEADVAIFQSANSDAFCAGVDIKDVHRALTEEEVPLARLGDEMSIFFEQPGALNKPVIAAIHGHCVGEGLVMALYCDLRIASDDATFALPEARIGVPAVNGTIRAVQLLGYGAAMELLLTGEPRDAAWATRSGLVNDVVPRDRLYETAVSLARSICAGDQQAINIMRRIGERALQDSFDNTVEYGLRLRESIDAGQAANRQQQFIDRQKGSS